MFMKKLSHLITIPCLFLIGISPLKPIQAAPPDSGASASISGTVVDSNGGVVSRVKIVVINDSKGLQRETVTNQDGYFALPFLPEGSYTLTAEMKGFATVRVTGLAAEAGLNSVIALELQPRGATELIDIRAQRSAVDTTSATIRFSSSSEQISLQPIIAASRTGRTVLDILPLLAPGIIPGVFVGPRGEGLFVNGSRSIANSFTIDGGDNNDPEQNIAGVPFPNPDALQELTVLTSNYTADVSGGPGAVINMVTRSGGNKLHGNLRYFFRPPALVVTDIFTLDSNRILQTFGGQAGGPLTIPRLYDGKDRTHFFVDFETNPDAIGASVAAPVLSLAERSGDFSTLPLPDPDQLVPHQPIDPLTGRVFPGGKIPENRFDPISKIYLDRFIPLPNTGQRTFRFVAQSTERNRQATLRLDHRISDSDNLSVTYLWNGATSTTPALSLPSGEQMSKENSHSFGVQQTHSFSPRTVNQITGTVTRLAGTVTIDQPRFTGVHPRDLGFTGIQPQTDLFLSPPSLLITVNPFALVGGFVSVSSDRTSFFPEKTKTVMSLGDELRHTRGTHTIGFGGGIRLFALDQFIPNDNGSFSFPDFSSGGAENGVADFLLGLPSFFSQATGAEQHQRQIAYHFFFVDEWRFRKNLTLNLGLRYEVNPPVTDKLDQIAVFRPGIKSRVIPEAPTGVLFPGDPDPVLGTVPRGGYPLDKNDLAPRIGIAYSPNRKTAIRAGFGVFYSKTFGGHLSDFAFQAPFRGTVSTPVSLTGDTTHPAFSDPLGANNPFPVPPGRRLFGFGSRLLAFDPTFRSGYTYQYSLSIQRELPGAVLLDVGYVGNNSFKLNREQSAQALIFGDDVLTRRIPVFFDVLLQESTGRARFDSLQVRLSRRLSSGLLLEGSYVFSKSLDNSSSPISRARATPTAHFSPELSDSSPWARSAFDRRHNFVISYTYSLPRIDLNGFWGDLVNGWQIGGTTAARSGLPLDIFSFDFLGRRGLSRPNIVAPFRRTNPHERQTLGLPFDGHYFFDPRSFGPATPGTLGTLGRNRFDGPGLSMTSISLVRGFKALGNRLEFRADIVNLFNQANFSQPVTDFNSELFGQILSVMPGTRTQIGVRYRF